MEQIKKKIPLPLLVLGCNSFNQYRCCLHHPTPTYDLLGMVDRRIDPNYFARPLLDNLLYWCAILKHVHMGGVTHMEFLHLVDNKSGNIIHLNNLWVSCRKYGTQIFWFRRTFHHWQTPSFQLLHPFNFFVSHLLCSIL